MVGDSGVVPIVDEPVLEGSVAVALRSSVTKGTTQGTSDDWGPSNKITQFAVNTVTLSSQNTAPQNTAPRNTVPQAPSYKFVKLSSIHGSLSLAGIFILCVLQICSSGTSLAIEYVADLNLLTASSALLIPTIILSASELADKIKSGNFWNTKILVTLASMIAFAVTLACMLSDGHGLGLTLLTTTIISNTILWVRDFIIERAPESLRAIPVSLQKPQTLLKELLTPTVEERFFIERSTQITLLASLLCIIVMMAKGTPALQAFSVGSLILLLLPLPLIVEIVPTIRAFVCRSLQKRGVYVERSETIDAIEGASSLFIEIPDHMLSATPPAAERGIWEFDRLDIFDGRFDEANLRAIISSLCSSSTSRFANEVARSFSTYPHHHKNTAQNFSCENISEIDSTTIEGTVEGVPLLIGKEGVFIQRGIFLSGHEVMIPSMMDEEAFHPDKKRALSITPHKVVVLLVGVGHACVGRLIMRLRWDYRGLEIARELDAKNLAQTSVVSTGTQQALDALCSTLQIDLSRSHGALTEYRIQQRVVENDASVAAFVNPERFSSTSETLNETVKIVSLLEAHEEFELEPLLRHVRNVVRLTVPSVSAIQALFEIPRKALLLRQILLISSIVFSTSLYILLLFSLWSPLICGAILLAYLLGITLAISTIIRSSSKD